MRQCLSNRKKAQRSRVLELPIPKLSAMWRNSLNSFSSKLLAFSSTKNPSFSNKPPSLLLLRIYSPRVNYGFFERSNSTSAGSTTGDTVKLGGIQIKDDRVRAFGSSAAAVDPSSLAAFSSAKEVVDLAKHYGQCYWELSKAKLRWFISYFYFCCTSKLLLLVPYSIICVKIIHFSFRFCYSLIIHLIA